jgi:hypothetical protein
MLALPVRTKRLKRVTTLSPHQTAFLILRSGPVVRHPLLFEAGTIPVENLPSFELGPLDPCDHFLGTNGMSVTGVLAFESKTVAASKHAKFEPPKTQFRAVQKRFWLVLKQPEALQLLSQAHPAPPRVPIRTGGRTSD